MSSSVHQSVSVMKSTVEPCSCPGEEAFTCSGRSHRERVLPHANLDLFPENIDLFPERNSTCSPRGKKMAGLSCTAPGASCAVVETRLKTAEFAENATPYPAFHPAPHQGAFIRGPPFSLSRCLQPPPSACQNTWPSGCSTLLWLRHNQERTEVRSTA
ncbi:hypothetical protein VTK26DRAFT_5540 [Humicola hyalothermophila]